MVRKSRVPNFPRPKAQMRGELSTFTLLNQVSIFRDDFLISLRFHHISISVNIYQLILFLMWELAGFYLNMEPYYITNSYNMPIIKY